MLDFSHLPQSTQVDLFSIFYASQSDNTTADSWETWTKPRGSSWLFGLIIGAGGGGGSPANNTTVGGGGGAPGSWNTFLIPTSLVPDTLYIRVGVGGPGGVQNGNAGSNGDTTYIATAIGQAAITSFNEAVLVTCPGAGGGAAAGTAGTLGAVATFSNQLAFGIINTGQGAGAATGGSGASGASVTWGVANRTPTSGGSGGGGGNAAQQKGGDITVTGGAGVAPFASLTGVAGANGKDGHGYARPLNLSSPPRQLNCFAFTGGLGGSSNNAGTGFNGGNGGYGCGGGGGGTSATTSGVGGSGGDGLVILMAW